VLNSERVISWPRVRVRRGWGVSIGDPPRGVGWRCRMAVSAGASAMMSAP